MNKLFACLVAVAAMSFSAGETQAQNFHRGGFGGSGFSISIGNGFNNGFNRGFNNFNNFGGFHGGRGVSVNVGNRGFVPYGGGFGVPVYSARSVYRPVYRSVPVYGGGFYGGGYRGGCGW